VTGICRTGKWTIKKPGGGVEFAGLGNDGRSRRMEFAGLENDGPENDGVEQEQAYILHTMKNFNVYDM